MSATLPKQTRADEVRPEAAARMLERALRRFERALLHGVLAVLALVVSTPVLWLLISSLKLPSEFGTYPIQILPRRPAWENYGAALAAIPYFAYMLRSMALAAAYATLTVISSALAGFGFARLRAPGRSLLFTLIVAMIMVPQVVMVIPQFILYSRLGLVGTYWPWVLWGLAGSPFHIFLFRQFFAGFPREIEDAAEIDGASKLRVFWQIFLPNAGPVIAASGIFAFQWVYGDFFMPSLFLNNSNGTLAMQLATAYVDSRGNPQYTLLMPAIVVFILPLVALFFVAQRAMVRGIVTTSLK